MSQFIFFLSLGVIIRFNLGIFINLSWIAPEIIFIAKSNLWYENFILFPQNLIIFVKWYLSRITLWITSLGRVEILHHMLYQVAEIGIAVMIYILTRKLFKVTSGIALWAVAVYIINPANWFARDVFTFYPALAVFAVLIAVHLIRKVLKVNISSIIGLAFYIAFLFFGDSTGVHFYSVLPFMTIAAAATPQLWPVYLLASAGSFIPFPTETYMTIYMSIPALAWAAVIYDQIQKK